MADDRRQTTIVRNEGVKNFKKSETSETYLALIENVNHAAAAHADFAIVFIDGAFGITDGWHVPLSIELVFLVIKQK